MRRGHSQSNQTPILCQDHARHPSLILTFFLSPQPFAPYSSTGDPRSVSFTPPIKCFIYTAPKPRCVLSQVVIRAGAFQTLSHSSIQLGSRIPRGKVTCRRLRDYGRSSTHVVTRPICCRWSIRRSGNCHRGKGGVFDRVVLLIGLRGICLVRPARDYKCLKV